MHPDIPLLTNKWFTYFRLKTPVPQHEFKVSHPFILVKHTDLNFGQLVQKIAETGSMPVVAINAGEIAQIPVELFSFISLLMVNVREKKDLTILLQFAEKAGFLPPISIVIKVTSSNNLNQIIHSAARLINHNSPFQDVLLKLHSTLTYSYVEELERIVSSATHLCIPPPNSRMYIQAYRVIVRAGLCDAGPVVNKRQEKLLAHITSGGRLLRQRLPVRRSHFSRRFLSPALLNAGKKIILSQINNEVPFLKNYLIDFPVVAVDPGDKFAGFALQREPGAIPVALQAVKVKNKKELTEKILSITEELEAKTVIIGIPYNEGFRDTSQSKKYLKLYHSIKEKMEAEGINVYTFDESFTSRNSEEYMQIFPVKKDRTSGHSISATIILQQFLREYDIF